MPELTDLSVIRTLCEKYDFALSKGFGQNFIINPGLPPKIVDASGVDKSWGVLEIGPGIGVLTKELAQRAAKVVSIEVDERLPPLLAETMAGVDNFKLVLQDVLKVDLRALIEEEFPGMPVAVCANLPYYITSPIVMKLLGDRLPIQNLTVMVQKEAADRLAAAPGTRASSAISCAVSYYATSKLMFTAAAGGVCPGPHGAPPPGGGGGVGCFFGQNRPDKRGGGLGDQPLYRAMAWSTPWDSRQVTASAARAMAASMACRSGPVNLLRTQSAMSLSGWGLPPTPTLIRGNWSVPRWAMMFFSPLCPPADPLRRTRSLPWGRETSSEITSTRSGGIL